MRYLYGMKAVILAAGEGKRMQPLTHTTPKPMLLISGKPLLEHLLDSIPKEINELIIVTGYLGDHIRAYFGNQFGRFRVHYVKQVTKEGTGHALFLCKKFFAKQERFLVLNADDLHSKKAIQNILKHPLAVLVKEVEDPRAFGVVTADANDHILEFVEKPEIPPSNLASIGIHLLDERIFSYPLEKHPNGEHYLVDTVAHMARDHKMKIIHTDFWIPIGYPFDLKKAEEYMNQKKPV